VQAVKVRVLSWAPHRRSPPFEIVRKSPKIDAFARIKRPGRFATVRLRSPKLLVSMSVCCEFSAGKHQHAPGRQRGRQRQAWREIIKLSDGGGLQLWITPDGAKRWRMAYRFGRAQKALAIGVYGKGGKKLGLAEARAERDAAALILKAGQAALYAKRTAKATQAQSDADTFTAVADELAEKKRRDGKAAATLKKFDWFLSFARPTIGAKAIREIPARDVLGVLKEVEARGVHEAARKLCAAIGDVFRYAIAIARADHDPAVASRGALVTPTVTPRAAIVEPASWLVL
jgi:hypothetical protein